MKIDQATIQFTAGHESSRQRESRLSLDGWPAVPTILQPVTPTPTPSTVVTIANGHPADGIQEPATVTPATDSVDSDPKLSLIRSLLELLLGHPIKIFDARDLATGDVSPNSLSIADAPHPPDAAPGLELRRTDIEREHEQTSFSASGVVQTRDGQTLHFSLDLVMERNFRGESSTTLRSGSPPPVKDPLILTLPGIAPLLGTTRFAFDLDANGTLEHVACVGPGSGFVALDRNGDGRVNDGRELFGAVTGNGFAELATLDADRNGWIDENDAAFTNLRLWRRDTKGNESLTTLAANGIGALGLTAAATPFVMQSSSNEILRNMRATSIFLQENGETGTMSQVDLTV